MVEVGRKRCRLEGSKAELPVFGVGLDLGLERKSRTHRWLPVFGLRMGGLEFVFGEMGKKVRIV